MASESAEITFRARLRSSLDLAAFRKNDEFQSSPFIQRGHPETRVKVRSERRTINVVNAFRFELCLSKFIYL
jgi:hypothetical protein